MVAAKTAKTGTKTAAKVAKAAPEEGEVKLGSVIMLYTKSSSHWYGMTEPEIVTIADTKFVRGKQITGKEGHRMEGKVTLVPLDHVASIIEFALEEDLWNESQPRNLPFPIDESRQSAVLTSHEQLAQPQKKHPARPAKSSGGRFGNGSKYKSRSQRYPDR